MGGGVLHVDFLRRTSSLTGAQVLGVIKDVASRHGYAELRLQDAALKSCRDGRHHEYDLSFRALLTEGRTWYTAHGFHSTTRSASVTRRMAEVPRALAAFRSVTVSAVATAVRAQCAALAAGRAFRPVRGAFYDTSPPPRPPRRSWVLWHRRWLLRALEGAAPAATLGQWLPTLPCAAYAHFMYAMYGHMHAPSAPALASAGGVHTPSVAEFSRANAARILSHKIVWVARVARKNKAKKTEH